jgi:predicted nucleotide-binding protein
MHHAGNDSVERLEAWSRYNHEILSRMVDTDDWANEYGSSHAGQVLLAEEIGDPRRLRGELDDYVGALKRFDSLLDLVPESSEARNSTRILVKEGLLDARVTDGRTVFVVHGHDHASRDTVELFLRRVGMNPIILAERPSRGNTVIEKIEREGVCNFAVVLLTPDDKGGPVDADPSTYRERARQNVLLELGFFIGRIGRDKVCALYKGDVEIPSDYSGVVWVRLDEAGGWKRELGKELEAVGLPVELSKG